MLDGSCKIRIQMQELLVEIESNKLIEIRKVVLFWQLFLEKYSFSAKKMR